MGVVIDKVVDVRKIREAMAVKGFKSDSLARRARIRYWQLYGVMRGNSRNPEVVVRICKALEIDPETIWVERVA